MSPPESLTQYLFLVMFSLISCILSWAIHRMLVTKRAELLQWEIYKAPIPAVCPRLPTCVKTGLEFPKETLCCGKSRLGRSNRGFLTDQFFAPTRQMIIILLLKLTVCVYAKNSVHYQKTQSWHWLLPGYCEIYHETFYGNSGVNGVHTTFGKKQ